MAINKKLIHFKTFANFNSKKLSANEANTQYTLGVDGEIQTGSPDILYQSICWIKDTKHQWTHGQLYDFSGGTSREENVQSDWLENTSSSDAYIKNRTHYINGTKITSAGTYTVTGSNIYFEDKILNLMLGKRTLLKSEPYVFATLTNSTSLVIEDANNYTATYPIIAITSIAKLDDAYIPDTIVRRDNLSTIAISGSYEDLQDKPVYITDFDVLSLYNLVTNPDDIISIQSSNQAITDALAANKIVLVPYAIDDDSFSGYATLVGYVEDLLYFKVITDSYEIIVNTSFNGVEISRNDVNIRRWSDKQNKLISGTNIKTINGESILGSGNIIINATDPITEDTVSEWGFTKNAGTITEVKANGTSISTNGVANIPAASTSAYGVTKLSSSTSSTSTTLAATALAVKAAYDLANGKQDKLISGTNIMTARGQSILTSGDLFAPIIINTNAVTSIQLLVGNCYIYSVAQTTAKTFVLIAPTTLWNDSINIIIQTSSTITFSAIGVTNIVWANGTIPTFESDKVYEISFRCTPMGWLGVAVAFHSI